MLCEGRSFKKYTVAWKNRLSRSNNNEITREEGQQRRIRQATARKETDFPMLFSTEYNYFVLKRGACRCEAASSGGARVCTEPNHREFSC